ncbi:MAG: PA2169 family four-helix-bundle protein [Pseudomonadota bacterium]|nr:PA2169 family four-helix-bundle protein [Pseudomonadota bacterium]
MFGNMDDKTALNTLLATLTDSINGYRDSAENTENSRFKQLFLDSAEERSRVAEDLRAEVRRLGGDPNDDGSFAGKTHQVFLDLKAAITGRDDKAIINEVERGEDYLKEKFEAALQSDKLAGESRAVVERAFTSVRRGHDRIAEIKHSMEAGA